MSGPERKVPDATELRHYLERGLTQAQIAAEWEKETGVRVSRSAIGMAIARYGLESARPRPRYEDTLPWRVDSNHVMHNDARMLRLEGRRRRGLPLSDDEKRWLHGWREALEEARAVVTYNARTPEGFYWVHRKDSDDDIIRR